MPERTPMLVAGPPSQRDALLVLALGAVLLGLLFGGIAYTKTQVLSVLTLYDVSLVLLAALALGRRAAIFDEPFFLLFGAVVAAYVLASLVQHPGFLTVRQAAMFGYGLAGALIVSRLADVHLLGVLVRMLRKVSMLAVVAQLAYGLVIVAGGGHFGDEQYHYLSPAAIVLQLVALGFFLADRRWWRRVVGTGAVLLCLYMSGHSTALLAAFATIAFPAFRVLSPRLRFLAIAAGFGAIPVVILLLVLSDTHSLDVNAMWRFFYWVSISREILVDYLGILGHGFGVPYASDATAFLLQVQQGYTTTLGEGDESFLSPPHNFLLTVAFHVGFVPACIFYVAVFTLVYRLAVQRVVTGPLAAHARALGFALVGATVWASFNVIIELPHASLVYWLLFFTALRLLRTAVPRGAGAESDRPKRLRWLLVPAPLPARPR